MPHRLGDGKTVVGLKQTTQMVKENRAKVVYVAKDADEVLLKPLIELCRQENVEVVTVDSMHELGVFCRIEVGASTAAIYEEKGGV
ncbi:MAG: ribosomal L7Ae/L30e/S12e/Gadd45 family protein [Limnochordia bacterium]|jgi:large subunit ribosomal protein L7A|nr:ribosomal L7Ae/L30e/S12e/Gadd45 family protein [Limnochordia bacterium]MDD2629143.1 ribosomal L7Ae/L30e/S12e/Gadd45 family protein [Limnochordia bacterium]MDD4517084.1 ribosomal L7Ae/L30e/S12e/Gadd45 family protein [Limnochordia bacterium]